MSQGRIHTVRDKDLHLAEQVSKDYTWARNYREGFEKDWLRSYKLYKSIVDTGTYPYESKLFIPYIFAIIEVQLPRIIQNIFSSGQFLDVQGRNMISQEMANMVKEIIAYQFERNINAFPFTSRLTKQVLLYGTSPAFVDWNYKTQKIPVKIPIKDDKDFVKYVTKKLLRVIKNEPMADVIDIFRYFQCPVTVGSPANDQSVLFAGWEFQKTYQELVMDGRSGLYDINKVKLLKDAKTTTDFVEDRLSILGKSGPRVGAEVYHREHIDLIKFFGMMPNEDDELSYKLITMGYPQGFAKSGDAEGIIIGVDDVPLGINNIPISLCRTNLMEGELYGIGDIQPVESLQIELNDQRNQRCDNVVRGMNQMWKVKRGNDLDESQFIFRPHGIIEVDDTNDIMPLVPNTQQLNQSLVEETVIKQDIQFATGVSDFIAGSSQNTSGFNDTATGIALIQAAADGRLVFKTQFLQVAIKEIAELVWKLDVQYLPIDTVVKVLDPFSASKFRFIKVSSDIIEGQYDFSIVNAPATGNPQVRRQQLIQIIDGVSKLLAPAQAAGQPINISYPQLLLRLLKEFNIQNIGEILPDVARMETINNVPSFVDQTLDDGNSVEPDVENEMMAEGQTVPVHPGDVDLAHIVEHERFKQTTTDADTIGRTDQHLSAHYEQMDKKKQLALQATQQGAQQQAQGGLPGNSLVNELLGAAQNLGLDQGEGGQSPTLAEGNEPITKEAGENAQITAV